jgi:hypothetical protein
LSVIEYLPGAGNGRRTGMKCFIAVMLAEKIKRKQYAYENT